jgi:uncharacterized protein
MLIGAISDSHDNLPVIEKAVQLLNSHKVSLVAHAGDFVAPFTILKFKKLHCELIGVFGNNDGDHETLRERASQTINCTIHDRFTQINLPEYKVALLHGHESELLNAVIDSGFFNAVIHGHSHNPSIERRGKTLVVNPGELCGYLSGRATLAILNVTNNEAQIIDL